MNRIDRNCHSSKILGKTAYVYKFVMAASFICPSKTPVSNARHEWDWHDLKSTPIKDESGNDASCNILIMTKNEHWTISRRIASHNPSKPKPDAWNGRPNWPHSHETNADMTVISLTWKCVAYRVQGQNWRPDVRAAPVHRRCCTPHFSTVREGDCRSCQAKRLTLNAGRPNGRSDKSCLRNNSSYTWNVLLTSWHDCTIMDFFAKKSHIGEYRCIIQ